MDAVPLEFYQREEGMPAAHAGVRIHFALPDRPGVRGMIGRRRAELLERAPARADRNGELRLDAPKGGAP